MTVKQVYYMLRDHWVLLALAVLLLSVTLYLFCGDGKNNKNEKIEGNIDQQKGVNSVLVNQAKEIGNEVNKKADNTNVAVNEFHVSVNRDSSTFSGDSTDRFCRRFSCDSTCAEWRKQHPDIVCNR